MDFFHIIVDVLAKRYGWSFTGIAEGMYWEDVYAMYEYASNLETIEINERMKFEFMLHAQVENALDNWHDTPLPYPDLNKKKALKKSAPNELPSKIKKYGAQGVMTPERQARRDEVQRKLLESEQRRKKLYDEND